jgi:hypothetical protein
LSIILQKGIGDSKLKANDRTSPYLSTKILNSKLLNGRSSVIKNPKRRASHQQLKLAKEKEIKMPQSLSPTKTNHEDASVPPTTLRKKNVRSTKSKELRSRDNYFTILTQNVYGLKNEEKIDSIVHRMESNNIDVYLAQETWLEGADEDYKIIEINKLFSSTEINKKLVQEAEEE